MSKLFGTSVNPRNVSKRFQKDISSRTKDIKQFSQLITHAHMDAHTDARTSVNLELTPPEVGQLKCNIHHIYESSVNHKQAKGEDLCEKSFCYLGIG